MPGTVATGVDNIKKVMRIALIGIKPAEQVMLKGYLRVILRLEADLEWVSATHPNVDLYMINQDFEQADSIQTLLKNNATCAAIFVDRCEDDNGSMQGNRLTMPLKEVSNLSLWLNDNVALLGGNYTPSVVSVTTQPTQQHTSKQAQPTHRLAAVLELIQLMRQRSESLVDLHCGDTLVATMYPKALQIIVHADPQFDVPWQLQANQQNANLFAQKTSSDLTQWLWQQAWQHPDYFAELIRKDLPVKLSSWAKPPADDPNRQQLLKLFTLLENTAMTIRQATAAVDMEIKQTKAQVVALFVAGLLNDEAYKTVLASFAAYLAVDTKNKADPVDKAKTADKPTAANTIEINFDELEPNPAAEQAVVNEQARQQEEQQTDEKSSAKLGFLSRLRQKLGL